MSKNVYCELYSYAYFVAANVTLSTHFKNKCVLFRFQYCIINIDGVHDRRICNSLMKRSGSERHIWVINTRTPNSTAELVPYAFGQ